MAAKTKKILVCFFLLSVAFAWAESVKLGKYTLEIECVNLGQNKQFEGKFFTVASDESLWFETEAMNYNLTATDDRTKNKLQYDLRSLVLRPMSKLEYEAVSLLAFFGSDSYIDIVICRSYAIYTLVRLDFSNNECTVVDELYTSQLYRCFLHGTEFENDFNNAKWAHESLLKGTLQPAPFKTCRIKGKTYRQPMTFLASSQDGKMAVDFSESEFWGRLDREASVCDVDALYKANSEMTEKNTTYKASNLSNYSELPWASALSDSIAKEQIEISSESQIAALVIGNGFYHSIKDDLYFQNSRPKEIEIIFDGKDSSSQFVTLKDSSRRQLVPLIYGSSKKIKIKIISVYRGTKYNDVCLNCIIPLKSPDVDEWRNFGR